MDSVGCVDAAARCDGQKQCPTGSDEENCTVARGCLDSDWMCGNRICIPKGLRCDGNDDCMDNSDEQGCVMCSDGGIQCTDGVCLSIGQMCDGTFHCSDGSDEPITCRQTCSVNNGGCSHMCTDEPWGALCTCPGGYKLSINGAFCQDVDECALPFAPCLHHCTNTVGSYYCHCREGFNQNEDFACRVTGNVTRLLTVQKTSLGLLNVKSQRFDVLQTLKFNPVALTYDIARSYYYWANDAGQIYKSDGKRSRTIYAGQPGIKALACDWLNGNLFWTNQRTKSISMQADDDTSYTSLLSKSISPSELVILPVESLMFWINTSPGDRVTLEKSWMDGSDRSSLSVLTSQLAHGLVIDVAARRLYWISDFKMSIETMKVDGTGRHSFTGLFAGRPALNLAVFEGFFYWVDNTGLIQVPQTQPSQKKILWKATVPVLTVYHELQQPQSTSACAKTPCQICLLTKGNPVGFTCTCPNSKVLMVDGTCQYPRFLYATSNNIYLLEFKGSLSRKIEIFATDKGILSFDVNWNADWLYWANQTGHIQRTSLTQVKTEWIPTPMSVCLLKIDQKSGRVFWVTCDQTRIGSMEVGSRYQQQLYHTTKAIRSLYLDWLRGGIIWFAEEQIFTMSMTGGKPKELLHLTGVIENIAFDLRAASLLWNSNTAGLTTLSLLQGKKHQAGRRWKISGSVVGALEPYLLSLSNDVMILWDRRDGLRMQDVSVKGHIVCVMPALGDIHAVPVTDICTKPSLLCKGTSICLPQSKLCDGQKDCPAGDDESFCVKCPSKDYLKCNDQRSCVSRALVCDGRSHCADGSDEVNCPAVASLGTLVNPLKCRKGYWLCKNGMECVSYNHVCDGERDCQDGSDEEQCEKDVVSLKPTTDASNEIAPLMASPAPALPACTSPSVLCPHPFGRLCISPKQFCDGQKDCPDGFDENNCVKRCPSKNDFRCKDRRSCISKILVCDGRAHCHDGSDELNCPNVVIPAGQEQSLKCLKGSQLCRDGSECVIFTHVCDGEPDCKDGSDEEGCYTATPMMMPENTHLNRPPLPVITQPPSKPSCTSPSFLCPDSSCITSTQLCDGVKDCPDGSDENTCIKRCPNKSDFLCKDRRSCVSKKLICNGRADCHDSSDEVDCPTLAPPINQAKTLKCRVGSQLCKDRTECVPYSHMCDGEKDCRDGSDEEECDAPETPSSSTQGIFQLPKPKSYNTSPKPSCSSPSAFCPNSFVCLHPKQICDGRKDCPDGSDEICVKRCPYKTDFLCKDRRSCLPKKLVCDGRADCHDSSDEIDCPTVALPINQAKTLKCRVGFQPCQDRTECVPYSHVCDGEKDCQDGSDEEECGATETPPSSTQGLNNLPPSNSYKTSPKPSCSSPSAFCPNSFVCVHPKQMCDGRRDCPDGSDEICVKRCPYKTDFLCKDRRSCVSKKLVCDGRADCHDSSDEVDCPTLAPPVTQAKTLKCRVGFQPCQDRTECVPYSHVCDGEKDCQDGSDEEECDSTETQSSSTPGLNRLPSSTKSAKPSPKTSCSSPSEFCPNSFVCLHPKQMCDGRKDCPDGSDEICVRRCLYNTDFMCKDRRSCISKKLLCDGRAHCHDGSDEVDCPSVAIPPGRAKTLRCLVGSQLCRDGSECVPFTHVCDGELDCRDGSDEDGCDTAATKTPSEKANSNRHPLHVNTQPPSKPSCPSPLFLCPDSSCIPQTQICDGVKDCLDGSDENTCMKRCPTKSDFLCKDRRSCVSKKLVCDGRSHCHDSSDEMDCPTIVPPTSRAKVLKCRMGFQLCLDQTECVPYSHVCDGEKDCRDGSDEEECDSETTPSSNPNLNALTTGAKPFNKPSCRSPSVLCPNSFLCIHPTQMCDGTKDCPDASDENCLKRCPHKTDFLCKDRRSCVSVSLVCDGRAHCHDGSDEEACLSVAPYTTTKSVLKCRTGTKLCKDRTECVLYTHVCDGERDCLDGSDEEGCKKTCTKGEFQCAHGVMCIPKTQVCDGRAHCSDHSDELDCWDGTKSCEFRCTDGHRCIPKKFLCDGEPDCVDGTDEVACDAVAKTTLTPVVLTPASFCIAPSVLCPGSSLCISQNQLCNRKRDCPDAFDESDCVFKCINPADFLCSDRRKCIPRMYVCDGRAQCPDGSDERMCRSPDQGSSSSRDKSSPLKCRNGFKACKDGLECVMYSHVCDGEEDCRDGSDEEECAAQCKTEEFECHHGNRCLPKEQVCDGQYDCQDRSDEMSCESQVLGCHHQCDNRTRCIPQTFLCDGERDCTDGSDEEKCGLTFCEAEQFRCNSGQCVSLALRCDGYADCNDGSDEASCSRPPRCPMQLRCAHSHQCLQSEWLCDGENDCKDGSDEKNCLTKPPPCRQYQWQCGSSSQCIPQSWRCDGKRDCHNGVDEDKCKQRRCPSHLYQCGSGECVDPGLVCSGFINCADSSDEGVGCTIRNCSSPSAPHCDHSCVSTPNGPKCYCGEGFTLHSGAVSCVDTNECNLMQHNACKHTCLNTRGSYVCQCHPGFYLEPDNKSCKTKDEALLVASVQSELLILGVQSGTLSLLSSTNRPVFSLDYHWAQQRVYWLSPDYQSIRWADMKKDSTKKGTLIKGVKSEFIAVDWVGKNLYWVDGFAGQIQAVRLSDTKLKSGDYTVVLAEDLEQPRSLVLLPHKGWMLWSEIGSTPQIQRSGMDGSKRKVVVGSGLSWPVSLAYDFLDDRVFWADEKLRCIGSAFLDGKNVKILQLAETPSPFSVAVFNDRLFWSDTKRRTIRSADKNTGKDQKVLLKRPGQPFGIKLMHSLSQPTIINPCDQLQCSHLCLLTVGVAVMEPAAVCRCPKGLLLSKDKISCAPPLESTFILLLSRTTVYQVYFKSLSHDGVGLKNLPNSRVLVIPGAVEASGLDLALQALSLYVADGGQGTVDVLNLSGPMSRQGLTAAGRVIQLKDESVMAMAVDWVTFNIYWSSTRRPNLHVTTRHDGYTTSLLQGSLKTTSIAVHPPSNQFCYTALVGSKSKTEVSCAWMDGRNKAVLWTKSVIPTSLVFSNKGNTIYWADTEEGLICSIALDGSGYKQYKTGPGLLTSFTYTENMLLWLTLEKDVTKMWFSDGFHPKQLWFETKTTLVQIKAYSNDSQTGSNMCKNNGGCEHLCLPYPGGRTCKCARGFYSVSVTSCAPEHPCPKGERACLDGGKCLKNEKFCDRLVDCPDQSDEQDCPYMNTPSKTKVSNVHLSESPHAPPHNSKDTGSCSQQHCNGHGRCATQGKAIHCLCMTGYQGEFCQEKESRRSHVGVVLGVFCLLVAFLGVAFIFGKRKAWVAIRGRASDKETLMSNMVLQCDHMEADCEELESSGVKRPPVAS
ncbi:low-density lipoprotein receptor-related protein 2 isoform X2 [Syngnathoides biaculeatus]|uniref:low-density lipoprotein receptor-related protein 2 isoform X2 n=1 Tax=Syngnathoides biaculeatus TaxID=300417 RepID=UPI002ADD8671|nr:low-density lipoprotein receptor-related protein 2 isoform X2 [Syngnathoides biaculeatus]